MTGSLHIGRMIGHTEMDMITRYRRMLGENALWIPGADNAGIDTQMVVERELATSGVPPPDLGEEFGLHRPRRCESDVRTFSFRPYRP